MMAKLLKDPERVEARLKKSIKARDTAEHREILRQRMARQRRSKVFRDAEAARGRETVARWHGDSALKDKANETMKATLAAKWADRVAVPLAFIGEFRILRRKRFTVTEAREMLRQEHQSEFARVDADRRAAALKTLGPAPAIGMPGRAEWTQRVAAVVAKLSVVDAASRARDGEGC